MDTVGFFGLISDLIVILAAGVAGVFAFYRFRVSRESEAILEYRIDPTIVSRDASTLVDIVVTVQNTGKSAVFVTQEQAGSCRFYVRSIDVLPDESMITWCALEQSDLHSPCDYLGEWFAHSPEEPLIFEPNSTEIFHVFFTTRNTGVIWLRAELVDKENNMWRAERLLDLGQA